MSATVTVAAAHPAQVLPLLPGLAPEIIPGTFESDLLRDAQVAYDPVAQLTYPAFTQAPEILAKGKTGTHCMDATNTWFGDWQADYAVDDNED